MLQMHPDAMLIPCKIPQFPSVMLLLVSSSLCSTTSKVAGDAVAGQPNALGTAAEVDNEVDLEEDDANGVSS